MKAIILAAGQGSRLRPLTDHLPKSLIPLWGMPLLVRQVKQLIRLQITDISVVTGYEKTAIEALGLTCIYNSYFNESNMLYSLSCALEDIEKSKCEEVLVLYGDIAYHSAHLQQLVTNDMTKPLSVLGNTDWLRLWQLRMDEPLHDAETFIFDDNSNLLEIGQKANSYSQAPAQYMGMLKFKRDVLIEVLSEYSEYKEKGEFKNLYLTELVNDMANARRAKVSLVDGGWIELDTLEDHRLYSEQCCEFFGIDEIV